MSEGRAMSCGSLSIAESPVLLVRASKILGASMKLFNLEIDQELSVGWARSRYMFVRVCVNGSHSVSRWWKVSCSCSQYLQTLDILGSI